MMASMIFNCQAVIQCQPAPSRERAVLAARKAAARRALGSQIIEDAEKLVAEWSAPAGGVHATAVRPDNRRRTGSRVLVPVARCPACRSGLLQMLAAGFGTSQT